MVPWLLKLKNSICACSIVSRVFIYASNEPFCGTLIINLGKTSICASYCKQTKTLFARIKQKYKICINNLTMRNYSSYETGEILTTNNI